MIVRELKFRAWLKDEKRMAKVHEVSFFDDKVFTIATIDNFYADDEFKLMQFTGLKDKNGKEVYEGDIVKFHDDFQSYTGVVTYMNTYGCFVIMTEGKHEYQFDYIEEWYCELNELEVIGNKYENQELLGE